MLTSYNIPQLIWAIINNRTAYFIAMRENISGMEVIRDPDFILINSNINSAAFNYVSSCYFAAETIDEKIKFILDYFNSRHLPFMWWVDELSKPDNLEEYLFAQGLEGYEHDVGMFVDLDVCVEKDLPQCVSVKQVSSAEELTLFARLLSSAFELPDNKLMMFYAQVEKTLLRRASPMKLYLAFFDAQPVATCLSFQDEGVAGFYNIATLPGFRGRGIASALLAQAMSEARQGGCELAVLQASEQGAGIYERLGFQSICQSAVFQLPS